MIGSDRRYTFVATFEEPTALSEPGSIYLDHAATTSLDPEVLDAMLPFLTRAYGNASSAYALGREARKGIDAARDRVAQMLGCQSSEVIFTSGGSESDN